MISAELLGAVEHAVKAVVRTRGTYRQRPDKSVRPFGGLNVVMFADFWQLPPVAGTYLCSNPLLLPSVGLAAEAMHLFWGDDRDCVQNITELHELMRCRDKWYNNVLRHCRAGNLRDEDYFYLNGFPTTTTALECPACNADVIDDPVIGRYKASWMNRYMAGEREMHQFIQAEETATCIQCGNERKRRNRVKQLGRYDEKLFCDAPALYSCNIPKYFTMLVRAQHFARSKDQLLTWTYARDKP